MDCGTIVLKHMTFNLVSKKFMQKISYLLFLLLGRFNKALRFHIWRKKKFKTLGQSAKFFPSLEQNSRKI
jgi:hypothetical protein